MTRLAGVRANWTAKETLADTRVHRVMVLPTKRFVGSIIESGSSRKRGHEPRLNSYGWLRSRWRRGSHSLTEVSVMLLVMESTEVFHACQVRWMTDGPP